MTVTLEQCCAAKVHLTICDGDGYCEFCGHQDSCTSTPDLTPVSYDRAGRLMFETQLIIDADESEHGWEIALRFGRDNLEAAWTDLSDEGLWEAALQIGTAVVGAIIASRNLAHETGVRDEPRHEQHDV